MRDANAALRAKSHEVLLAAWTHELSAWLAAIRHKIVFPTGRRRTSATYPSYAPGNSVLLADQEDLENDFWVCFAPMRWTSRAECIMCLEALELLSLLASCVSKPVCWDLLNSATKYPDETRSLGWALFALYELRPRFECRFLPRMLPSDAFMTLILDGVPDGDHSTNYARVRSQLLKLAPSRACERPVQLRFHFGFPEQTVEERAAAHDAAQEAIAKGRRYGGPLRGLKRILTVAEQIAARPPRMGSTWMEVAAFGFHMYKVYVSDDAREWLRAIASHVPVYWLVYGVSSLVDGIGSYYGPFLWRLLAPHPSRRAHLGLRCVSIHAYSFRGPSQIIAFCSALAQSQTLREFTFAEDSDSISDADSRVWADWLAFALFSNACRHRIRTVNLNFRDRVAMYAEAMNKVLQEANPIAYLAAGANGADSAGRGESPRPLESVRLRANSNIHGDGLPVGNVATTMYHGKRVAECLVADNSDGEMIRILIPGVGFGCVDRKDVETTQPSMRVGPNPIRSLSLCVRTMDVPSVETILRLVGRSLTTVGLRDTGTWESSSTVYVERFLPLCPNAKRIYLDFLKIPLPSITTATWGRKVESLAIRSCRIEKPTEQDELTQKFAAPLTVLPKLSSLYFHTEYGHHPPELQDFLIKLDIERDLERFLVLLSNDSSLRARYTDHTKNRDGRPLPRLRVGQKLAFLSVASAGRTNPPSRGYRLNPDTISYIFEFVGSHDRISIAG